MIQALIIKIVLLIILSLIVHDINIIAIGYENVKALKFQLNNFITIFLNFFNSLLTSK